MITKIKRFIAYLKRVEERVTNLENKYSEQWEGFKKRFKEDIRPTVIRITPIVQRGIRILKIIRSLWVYHMIAIWFFCFKFLDHNAKMFTIGNNNMDDFVGIFLTTYLGLGFILLCAMIIWFIQVLWLYFTLPQFWTRHDLKRAWDLLTWAFTAFVTITTKGTWKLVMSLYLALFHEEPRDVLINNHFFSIDRLWKASELELHAAEYARKLGFALSDETLAKLSSGCKTLERMLEKTYEFCLTIEPHVCEALVQAEPVLSNSQYRSAYFTGVFATVTAYVICCIIVWVWPETPRRR